MCLLHLGLQVLKGSLNLLVTRQVYNLFQDLWNKNSLVLSKSFKCKKVFKKCLKTLNVERDRQY